MKRNAILLAFLFLFSLLAGYLLSHISFVGRLGVNLFYTEYKFLKSWWKGGLAVLVTWLIIFLIHYLTNKNARTITVRVTNAVMMLVAVFGLYFSYYDFRHTLSHKLLGERFHLGVYLFWIGWIAISIYFMAKPRVAAIAMAPGVPNDAIARESGSTNVGKS